MTVPLDTRQDIRVMDALGVPRAQIARSLGVSRNTVAKYADMEDMSPAAPVPQGEAAHGRGPARGLDRLGPGGRPGRAPEAAAHRQEGLRVDVH